MVVNVEHSQYAASISHAADTELTSNGWRSFFAYRDLGVKGATNFDYDFRVVHAREGDPVSTGWHYHACELQVIYCLGGWEVIGLEDGRTVKLVPGSCLNIPPGYVHNEISYSPDLQMMVVVKPAVVETVSVDTPEAWIGRELTF